MLKKLSSLVRIEDIATVLFAFVSLGVISLLALNLAFLGPVAQTMKDFSFTDIFYNVLQETGRPDTSRVVTIVDMTYLPSRADIADVIEQIEDMNPKVLGIDIVFEGEKEDTLADRHLAALATRENTVWSYRLQDYANDTIGYDEDIHSFFAEESSPHEGFTNFERRLIGGLKRNINLQMKCRGEDRRPSFVEGVAQVYADGHAQVPKTDKLAVNFRPTVFRVVTPDSLEYYRDLIEDHVVLFGATDQLEDRHYTPLGEMAGVELLAYSVQTLLEQSQVKTLSPWVIAIISFFVVLLTHLLRKRYLAWAKTKEPRWLGFFLSSTFIVGLLMTLWTIGLVWVTFLLFFTTGYSVNLAWAMAAIPFLGGAREFYGLVIFSKS